MSRLLKNLNVPAEDRTGDPSILSRTLYHVALKTGLYRKAVQVFYIPNLIPVVSPYPRPPYWIRPRILRSMRITWNGT